MPRRVLYSHCMTESKGGTGLWIAGIAGLVAIGTWLAMGGTSEPPESSPQASVPTPIPTQAEAPKPQSQPVAPKARGERPGLRIAPNGRLAIDHDALPAEGPLLIALELPDEFRGTEESAVRIISTDGRRTDTTASPLPGAGSGLRVAIDPSVLSRGRYMIEIDTVGNQPLRIRRYVLEIR